MKTPLVYRTAIIWFCLGLFSLVHAQTGKQASKPVGKSDQPLKHIRVQVEFIDVSHEQYTELMFGEEPSVNDGELRKQVAQLVKDGKASMAETMLCTALSGQKATNESVEEVIYPTEYDAAEFPEHSHAKEGEAVKKAEGAATEPAIGPLPTAFEPRNVGSTLEIEPTISNDEKIIDLRMAPEIVYHVGSEVWAEWKDERSNCPIKMPIFYTLRLNTNLTLTDGHYLLAAALTPKNKDGKPDVTRKLMVFVRANVVKTGP